MAQWNIFKWVSLVEELDAVEDVHLLVDDLRAAANARRGAAVVLASRDRDERQRHGHADDGRKKHRGAEDGSARVLVPTSRALHMRLQTRVHKE